MAMKTIIITGANGNLGNAVTQKFLASGYRVIATVIGDDDKLAMPVNAQLDVRVFISACRRFCNGEY